LVVAVADIVECPVAIKKNTYQRGDLKGILSFYVGFWLLLCGCCVRLLLGLLVNIYSSNDD